MNVAILKAYHQRAKSDEEFWFTQHRDAVEQHSLNDFGWLYAHAKEGREKLEQVIAKHAAATTSPEATPNYALVQLLNAAMLHPEQAEGYIRRVIAELGDDSPETPVGGEALNTVRVDVDVDDEGNIVFGDTAAPVATGEDEGERMATLLRIVSAAADMACLRGRRVHCVEREPKPADWCVACQAKHVLSGE